MSSSAMDTPELAKIQSNAGAKRPREESDIAKSKLIDQKFDMSMGSLSTTVIRGYTFSRELTVSTHVSAKYADPLAPRQGSSSQFLPQGVTGEMDRKWLATIAAFRNQSG